jgi:hypothetical protein
MVMKKTILKHLNGVMPPFFRVWFVVGRHSRRRQHLS